MYGSRSVLNKYICVSLPLSVLIFIVMVNHRFTFFSPPAPSCGGGIRFRSRSRGSYRLTARFQIRAEFRRPCRTNSWTQWRSSRNLHPRICSSRQAPYDANESQAGASANAETAAAVNKAKVALRSTFSSALAVTTVWTFDLLVVCVCYIQKKKKKKKKKKDT